MTDLTKSLWGAGLALILIVVVYNFWQEYKARKHVQRAFGEHRDDVLMNQPSAPAKVARQEPSFGATSLDHPAPLLAEKSAEASIAELPVDDFIDCVVPMEFEHPLRGDRILAEIQSIRIAGNKPVHFIGKTPDGERETITHAGSYSQISAGVQLVNRSGALNELEFSDVIMKLRQVADNLNGFLDIPDMKHVMDGARDLALFVAEHDAQLSVNVRSNGVPWDIGTLMAALEKLGFDARPDARLAMPDGEGGTLFTLSVNGSLADRASSRMTLLLDVPCVGPNRTGFQSMIACARLLAQRLGGTLVDDGDTVIDDATLEQIQDQVDVFYSAMQAAEIPAGSTRALRIFS